MPPQKYALFPPEWTPTLLREEILAKGTWWYDGEIPHEVVLKSEHFDYCAKDFDQLEKDIHPVHMDYIDYAISDDGVRYVWYFDGPNGVSKSKSLTSLDEAKEHIRVYGRVEVKWLYDGH